MGVSAKNIDCVRRGLFGRLRFWRDRQGSTIVEFTILMPVFVSLLLASVETANYFWARGRVQDAGSAIGDMATRFLFIHDDDVTKVMEAADVIIAENNSAETSASGAVIKLTQVLGCDVNPNKADQADDPNYQPEIQYRVLWSHIYDNGVLKEGEPYKKELTDIPTNLTVTDGETLMVTDLTYIYKPKLKYLLPEDLFSMHDVFYNRPRSSGQIIHTGSLAQDPIITCTGEADPIEAIGGGGETDEEHDNTDAGNSQNSDNNNNSDKNQGVENGQGGGTSNKDDNNGKGGKGK